MKLIQKIDDNEVLLFPLPTENPEDYFKAIEGTVPDGFQDISSAEGWDNYGYIVKDYLFYRYEIQVILIPLANPNYPTINFSGWGNLTASQKEIMSRYILAPYSLRLTVFSDADDEKNWFNLLNITQGLPTHRYTGRALLIERMRKHVANKVRREELALASTQQFFEDIFLLIQYYIASANPKFKLWLTNAVGTAYENDGFEQKSYWSQQLEDELMDIYNGVV